MQQCLNVFYDKKFLCKFILLIFGEEKKKKNLIVIHSSGTSDLDLVLVGGAYFRGDGVRSWQ